jgi:hypothetical protein
MRIISVITVFTLATVVYTDATPSNSGVTEASSLQTRRLRGEVHEVRIRRHAPVDGIESTSAEATAGGDQAPPIRQKKSTSSENEAAAELLLHFKANGGGAATTRTGIPRPPRSQNDQFEDESTSAEAPAAAGGDLAPPIRKKKSISSVEEAPSTENDRDHPSTTTVKKVRFSEQLQGPTSTPNGNLVSSQQPRSPIIANSGGTALSRETITGTVRNVRFEEQPQGPTGTQPPLRIGDVQHSLRRQPLQRPFLQPRQRGYDEDEPPLSIRRVYLPPRPWHNDENELHLASFPSQTSVRRPFLQPRPRPFDEDELNLASFTAQMSLRRQFLQPRPRPDHEDERNLASFTSQMSPRR